MRTQTKLRIHNLTMKATLRYRREMCVLNNRDNQCLEMAQMKLVRPLLEFTKINHQRNKDVRETASAKYRGRHI
jgi:hypothetical protein